MEKGERKLPHTDRTINSLGNRCKEGGGGRRRAVRSGKDNEVEIV